MMYTITIIGIISAILLAFLVYWSKAHWIIKSLVLIGLLIKGMLAFVFYQHMLGAPILGYPSYEFQYVHHIVTADEEIILWVYDIEKEHRLYLMPYDRESAIELEKARQGTENGIPMVGEFETDVTGDTSISLEVGDLINGQTPRKPSDE